MRTFGSSVAQRRASSSGAQSPLNPASITITTLLILSLPVCRGAPAELQESEPRQQLLTQIDAVCSSFLAADLKFWASDVLGELCVLMLLQKSKGLKVQEKNMKRAELQGPGGIQSRGYFLYRPRNGRRSPEYE